MSLTNYPNGVTSFGMPVIGGGGKYAATGNTYFVGKGGSSSGPGTWDEEYLTIASCVTVMNARISWSSTPWANDDALFIKPGLYAETLTSFPYGCSVIGMGDNFDINGERGVTIQPASGSPFDATSVINMRIENICFKAPSTSVVFQADNFNRNIVLNCLFAGAPGASPSTTRGLEITTDMTGNLISGCKFLVIRNGIYIVTDNANSKQASGNIIEHCYVAGADQTGIYFDANCVPSYTQINHCVIGDGGTTLALGLDDNTGVVNVSNTMFTATACDPASADSDSKYNNCYLNGTLMT